MEGVGMGTNPIWEVSAVEFFFVTIVLGGGAAFLTGRAIAISWLANHQLAIYVVLLTAATRFIHFALFEGTLISPWYFCVDLIVLLAMGFAGKSMTRSKQMATQYGFLSDKEA